LRAHRDVAGLGIAEIESETADWIPKVVQRYLEKRSGSLPKLALGLERETLCPWLSHQANAESGLVDG
jgi:hypothetical protein